MSDHITTVYGCSDDLIEMDGAIYDEISRYDAPTLVEFNNGVRLRVEYDRDRDGIWRIEDQSKLGARAYVTIVRCEDRPGYTNPDGDIYSDLATVIGARSFEDRRADS